METCIAVPLSCLSFWSSGLSSKKHLSVLLQDCCMSGCGHGIGASSLLLVLLVLLFLLHHRIPTSLAASLAKPGNPSSHDLRPKNQLVQSSPKLSLTHLLTLLLNSFGSSLHIRPASTFAALSSFGLLSMLMTLRRMVSGVWTGDQRSAADS